jgi:hypothetical protein
MGQLIDNPLPSLFNGVSRQPSIVRQPNQCEEANDLLMSVVTGGWEKRPNSHLLATLDLPSDVSNWKFHAYERDQFEAYFIAVSPTGDVRVFNAKTGARITVNAYESSYIRPYLTSTNPRSELEITTANDYTFVMNLGRPIVLWPPTPGNVLGNVKKYDDLPGIKNWPKTGDIWRVRFPNGYTPGGPDGQPEIYLEYMDGSWVQRYTAGNVPTTLQLKGDVSLYSELPGPPPPAPNHGDIWRITQDNTSTIDDYYVQWDSSRTSWLDVADPYAQNQWNPATMPLAIIRETNGTFSVKQLPWAPRKVGDAETVKVTKLVNTPINDMFIFKGRLGLVGNEHVQLSKYGDLFNLWPDKATQALDSDPIDRPASESGTTRMRYAIPFRKAVVFTSARSQFELTSEGALTAATANLDLSTTYQTKNTARPITAGDVMYFAGDSVGNAIVYEYYYEDSTLTNTAADVTKHVFGFIPAPITMFEVDTAIGMLFAHSTSEPGNLFVYTTYFDGKEKVQSAWGRWRLNADEILSIKLVDGQLHYLARRGSVVTLEKVATSRQDNDPGLNFTALLDCRVKTTGSYDPVNKTTSWTLPYPHKGCVDICTSGDWGTKSGRVVAVDYTGSNVVTAKGNWAGQPVFAGYRYQSYYEFSKQHVRVEDAAILGGRLQLRSMTVFCEQTGYLEAHVTPEQRPTRIHKMTGRVLGSAKNRVGSVAIDDVKFRFRIGSRGDTVKIALVNDTPYPSCVTSASWLGFFNEISKQEQ